MSPEEIETFLTTLQLEAERLSNVIDVPKSLRLQNETSCNDGCWLQLYWREAMDGDDEDGYYIALMRKIDGGDWQEGEVALRYASNILFRFFESVTHQLAVREIGETTGADPRRRLFARQEELMARLNPEWGNWTREHHELVLVQAPFIDKGR